MFIKKSKVHYKVHFDFISVKDDGHIIKIELHSFPLSSPLCHQNRGQSMYRGIIGITVSLRLLAYDHNNVTAYTYRIFHYRKYTCQNLL